MNYSVLRKFLSTTSLVAVSATLAACSGDVQRFGSPAFAGYSSNQQEIFTNSIQHSSAASALNVQQPMPAQVATVAPTYNAPVYAIPAQVVTPVVQAPVVTNAVPMRVAQAQIGQRIPVPPANIPSHGTLTAVPVQAQVYQPAPVYQSVNSVPVPALNQQPVYAYPQGSVQPDYAATSSIKKSTVLSAPPVVISSFHSMPKAAPRRKSGLDLMPTASVGAPVQPARQLMPSSMAVHQPMPPKPLPTEPVVISKFYSLPKRAPRTKNVDYSSTASIAPAQGIPIPQIQVPVAGGQSAQTAKVAAVAPISLNRNQFQSARTSGQWTSVGGSMVTARPGDDLNALSRRYGVPAKAIADVNGLAGTGYVTAGQKVLIPVYSQAQIQPNVQVSAGMNGNYAIPSVIRTPKSNPLRLQSRTPYGQQIMKMQQTANADKRHMVMPGDTLSSISRRYGVSVSKLAAANNMDVNTPIRMGQRLHVPSAVPAIDYTSTASIDGAAAAQPSAVPLALGRIPKAKPQGLMSKASMPVVRQQSNNVAALPKAKARQKVAALAPRGAGAGSKQVVADIPTGDIVKAAPKMSGESKFRWPVRGRIISSYGRKRDGGRNDGINLAVPAGTSVRVAESGTVIYSGDKLKGYGNLVLVQHPNGWVTAYAHNDKLLVSKGQQVRRGQIIAQAGKTGEVDTPQLHFELRIKGDPVDPVPYLSST